MSDYKELISDLRDAEQANWKRLSLDAAAAIEDMSAQLADKDYLIQQQMYEIQRLMADVKRQQEKMFELAKKLPKRGERTINPYESTWAIENGYI